MEERARSAAKDETQRVCNHFFSSMTRLGGSQLERYSLCRLDGADHKEALHAVVDEVLEETRTGIGGSAR